MLFLLNLLNYQIEKDFSQSSLDAHPLNYLKIQIK